MKEINRPTYLNKLIERRENGLVKVITGIRRCGKSYLLNTLYYNYLLGEGVDPSHIIKVALDDEEHEDLLDRKVLGQYVRSQINETDTFYIMLDEIQLVPEFEKVVNGLNRLQNLDVYVTGSNSKFLSTDIKTEFRGRGDEVHVHPLSFSEFLSAYNGTKEEAWNEYVMYGGLPLILNMPSPEAKSSYLKSLFEQVYKADVIERNHFQNEHLLDTVVNTLASSVGSLTNPLKITNSIRSAGFSDVSDKTVSSYIKGLKDSFLIEQVERYDVKGRKYIASPYKYYFTDVGLRNARLNFRQQEENHLMENIIYNELLVRGFNVDVGIVKHVKYNEAGKQQQVSYEVDFVCNKGSNRYYIQSAYEIPNTEKMEQESNSLKRIDDSFKKIIIVNHGGLPWHNEDGILVIQLQDFLLNENSLDM